MTTPSSQGLSPCPHPYYQEENQQEAVELTDYKITILPPTPPPSPPPAINAIPFVTTHILHTPSLRYSIKYVRADKTVFYSDERLVPYYAMEAKNQDIDTDINIYEMPQMIEHAKQLGAYGIVAEWNIDGESYRACIKLNKH